VKPEPRLPVRKLDILADIHASAVDTFELAPDGSRLAYVAGGHLWVRELSSVAARDLGALPEQTYGVVWSADARIGRLRLGGRSNPHAPSLGRSARRRLRNPGNPSHPRPRVGRGRAGDGGMARIALSRQRTWWNAGCVGRHRSDDDIDFHSLVLLPDGRAVFATHRANDRYTLEIWDGKSRSALLPPMS
jgi:hypothetical protein